MSSEGSRRVVVTGMSLLTPIGADWPTIKQNMLDKKSGIRLMTEWEIYKGLHSKLAAPILDFELPEHYTRKQTRSMGRVAQMAVRTAELALADAKLLGNPVLKNGQTGVAYGSSSGSVDAAVEFYSMLINKVVAGINSTSYLRSMSHTCAVNVELFFELTGRLIQTGTACTSGSLAIGSAYEAIKHGYQKIMIAGGAEELNPTQMAVFDTLYATSTKNDSPELTPRAFDKDRDGIVIGEGAGTLILEELEHAKERGATIYAELVGFATNTDGTHLTKPNTQTMEQVMRLALQTADLKPKEIGYLNAHGTATKHGDIAETQATFNVFGSNLPVSACKGYIGHTLGACGSVEAIMSIKMMNEKCFLPNLNLHNIDESCAQLAYIVDNPLMKQVEYCMSNNFAFGGINTSLIFKDGSLI
jgi:3-oxoacyl-[acyl-carrier-protein] synthase II